MPPLTVTLVQADPVWEDRDASLAHIEALLPAGRPAGDLIILPEMFTTGFSMHPAALAESMDGPAVRWLRERAAALASHITGSLIISAGGQHFNRLLWASPQGDLWHYDKRHLFRMAGEDRVYRAGDRRLTVSCNSWRVRPFVCYDLRFPVWIRNLARPLPYDLAIFVANWPATRASQWRALLRARAIENQCFVAGVNRVGRDGNGLAHQGDSMLIDPLGETRLHLAHQACAATCRLEREALEECRRHLPFLQDADPFRIEAGGGGGAC